MNQTKIFTFVTVHPKEKISCKFPSLPIEIIKIIPVYGLVQVQLRHDLRKNQKKD
jgi:hypothetical protein